MFFSFEIAQPYLHLAGTDAAPGL